MSLTAGVRLGPYEIVAPLGAGGMGEVYKAHDTRLGRTVAVKILAPALSEDPSFRARFDREAQTISRLSNSHICTLFDVGKDRGVDYLVLEYLDGQTLADACRKGPMPVARALALGLDICDALAAAHRAGVLHRDLKPGNVMLTASGLKLLDFGLAIAAPAAAVAAHSVATVTTPLTAGGTLLGTSQYMAPEQYEGRAADTRSDIWALGCVLYEMIAGRRPFDGETAASIIGAIVSSDPPALPTLAPAVSAAIERVIRGCLDKDPEARWQDVRDVRRALEAARDERAAPPASASRSRAGWVAATAGALAIAVAALAVNWRRDVPASPIRFDFNLAAPAEIQRFNDTRLYFVGSPDSTRVVIAGTGGLWIKETTAASAYLVPGTAGAEAPFWSPDGRSIGFFLGGPLLLKRIALDGGAPKTLCRILGIGWNGAWAPDGTILFSEWGAQRMMRVSQDGGEPAVARTGQWPAAWPQFLPDGRHFLFNNIRINDGSIDAFVGSLDTADITRIDGVQSRMEYVAGRLVFWRDGTLFAQPFDIGGARLTGSPATLADHVHGFAITGFGAFSASPGALFYQSGVAGNSLEWRDRQGRPLGSPGPAADYISVRLSPDLSSVAYDARDQDLGTNDLYILDLNRNAERRLTTDRRTENLPIWTPDGRSIVYSADRTGAPSLFVRPANGPGEERAIVPPSAGGPQRPGSMTPDGKFIVYVDSEPRTASDILIAPMDGSRPPEPVVRTRARESQPQLSVDGRWMAYVSDESGRNEVYVQAFRDASTRRQVSQAGGSLPRWRGDGREIYFLDRTREHLFAADVTVAGTVAVPGIPHLLLSASRRFQTFDVTPDGQRFLLAPDAPREAGAVSVVLNWQSLLK